MREIKFRGKRINGCAHVWLFGYLAAPDQIIVWNDEKGTGEMFQVIPETVGQFTGLKDKNDQPLDWWDGDLISSPNGIVVEIYWNDISGQWWGRRTNARIASPRPLFPEYTGNSYMKVIGNIHQHPNLLE